MPIALRLVSIAFSMINIGAGVNRQLKTGFIGGGADICQDVSGKFEWTCPQFCLY